jgi:uncharacterized membrane protein
MPTWDSLHTLVIHFPIALLFVAPLFVVAGLAVPKVGKWFSVSALALMLLGALGAAVAVSTGEEAAELAVRTSAEMSKTLELHEEMAEATEKTFFALAAIYAAIVIAPAALKKELKPKVNIPLQCAFLAFYAAGMILLANTAHQGGLLVHEHGVQALLPRDETGGSGGLAKWFAEDEGKKGKKGGEDHDD